MAINKLPIKKMVEFRRLSETKQITYVNNLKISKEVGGGGGNYWVRSLSAVSRAFKENDNQIVIDKLDEVSHLHSLTQRTQTKTMYKRNMDILSKYIDFDFTSWRPAVDLNFIKKPSSLLEMKGLPVQVLPNHVFSYGTQNNKSIGGIWFINWLDGFKTEDLGIYSEALYRYLSSYFSKNSIINPAACMIVDISEKNVIGYDKVLNGEIPSLLDFTLEKIKRRAA